jgi:hypothetical protein
LTESRRFGHPHRQRGIVRRALATALVAGVVALSWTQVLDDTALTDTDVTLKRALAAFAVARALNGVISVAQGTELAVQPVGVGVTITVGEILDPLNDLVESFSWLALLACVSLGTQMLLAEVMVNPWVNGVLSAGVAAYLIALWWPGALGPRRVLLRVVTVLAFARFLFAIVTLTTAWTDQAVLADRQEAALSQIELAQAHIEELREHPIQAPEAAAPPSMLERLGTFLDEQRQALNIRTQLDALTERVESAIEELINLFVVFTVQTILVPVAALLLAYWTFLWLWRWSWRR